MKETEEIVELVDQMSEFANDLIYCVIGTGITAVICTVLFYLFVLFLRNK